MKKLFLLLGIGLLLISCDSNNSSKLSNSISKNTSSSSSDNSLSITSSSSSSDSSNESVSSNTKSEIELPWL